MTEPTGTPVPPPAVARFTGGANVPASGVRVDVTWPLGKLKVTQTDLALTVQPKWIRAEDLHVSPSSLNGTFRVRRRFGFGGVGFELPDGREWYFWTTKADEILTLLTGLGYAITAPRRRTKIWTGTP